MQKEYLILFLFLFLSIHIGFSQYVFDQIKFNSVKGDFPTKGVNSIIEDQDGFIWFGLDGEGLVRFDGSNFKTFNYNTDDKTSINGNFVFTTFIDTKGQMWVGTSCGLNIFNQELNSFKNIKITNDADSTKEVIVKSIIQYDDDHIILGTDRNGVIKINLNTHQFFPIPFKTLSKANVNINELNIYSGKVYSVTNKGLLVFDEDENLFKLAEFPTANNIQLLTQSIESISVDKENMWLGTTRDGLIKVTAQNKKYQIQNYSFTKKRILSIISTKENQLFCATENDGLFFGKKNEEEYTFKKFNNNITNSNSIWTLYEDSQNRIWMGTFNNGVSVYDKLFNKFNIIEQLPNTNSLKSRGASSIFEDDFGNIWIGMDGGGINIYNPITKQSQVINTIAKSEYVGLTSNDISAMFLDSKGNIWAGSWGSGIYFLKKNTKHFINYTTKNTQGNLTPNWIYDFSEDSKGRIWIATFDMGILYFDPVKNTFFPCNSENFESHGLANGKVQTIKVDSKDNLWLGSTKGLFKVNVEEDALGKLSFDVISYKNKMLEISQNPSAINICAIHITLDQQILVGTKGAGLFRINKNNVFEQYKNDVFKQETIGSIIENTDKSIWVSHNKGITNVEWNSNKVTTYDQDDGFSSNYYLNSVCCNKSGTIYYSNDKLLNYFKPSEVTFNQVPPKLHFTSFKIFNKEITHHQKNSPLSKPISKTKKITLNYDHNFFCIGYVGINFTRPDKNQYAFQLEGIDSDWRYVGNEQKTTYTNIRPGHYTFKLKASNNDGIWNETPIALDITILPPWWKSNLAYLCYTLLFLSLLYYLNKFYHQRVYDKQSIQIERQKRLQEEQLRLKEEQLHQNKLEFFTNISHEFKTPLTLIMNPLEDIVTNKDIVLSNEIRRKHQIIYKNAHRLNRLITELMDFRKLKFHKTQVLVEQVEVVNYVKEILSYFNEEAEKRNIKFEFQPNTNSLVAWLDLSMTEKIIFNLLSNAFRVTPSNGMITVALHEKQMHFEESNFKQPKEGFTISIQDTGGGLTQSEIGQIFQRFSQVKETNNNYYGGTGIGLEMVKAFTQLQKGKIDVWSKVGKGSIFTVSFLLGKEHFKPEEISNQNTSHAPIAKVLNSMPLGRTQKMDTSNITNHSKKEHTILIVEDNMDLRDFLESELENEYNILLAENGKTAFEIALKETPHIILTDVMMPIMDGLELCEKIKKDLKTSHIPLLMLTAKSMLMDKVQGIDSGADAFLSKPIDMALLKSSVVQLLKSRQILFNKFSKNDIKSNKDAFKKPTSLDNVFIKQMMEHILDNIAAPDLTVESVANHFFLSRSQLYRKTKSLTGITVNEFIKKIRLEEASKMIKTGDGNISEISYKVGFSSPSYFSKCFKEEYGTLPTEIK